MERIREIIKKEHSEVMKPINQAFYVYIIVVLVLLISLVIIGN